MEKSLNAWQYGYEKKRMMNMTVNKAEFNKKVINNIKSYFSGHW